MGPGLSELPGGAMAAEASSHAPAAPAFFWQVLDCFGAYTDPDSRSTRSHRRRLLHGSSPAVEPAADRTAALLADRSDLTDRKPLSLRRMACALRRWRRDLLPPPSWIRSHRRSDALKGGTCFLRFMLAPKNGSLRTA